MREYMDHKTFSERLTESMASQGLKQVDLLRTAKEAGVKLGKSQLSQYISGKTASQKKYCHIFGGYVKSGTGLVMRFLLP